MRTDRGGEQPWEKPETIFESEYWTIIDLRPLSSFQLLSENGGFAFTISYDEWDEFVEAIRTLETEDHVESELLAAEVLEAEGTKEWQFTLLFPEHTLLFFQSQSEWESLQAGIEATADYPWSETLYRVDVAGMREKVAEQRRWLARRDRQQGGRG